MNRKYYWRAFKVCVIDVENKVIKQMNVKPNQILDNLFLGSEMCATDFSFLTKNNIKNVLIIGHLIEKHFEHHHSMNYKQININDEETENIFQYFEECFEFIENILSNQNCCDESLLIHCVAGVSRSATITIAYLMKKYR